MAEIWVYVHGTEDGPATIGLELLTKARDLGTASAVYVGPSSDEAFATLGAHGASVVYHIDPADRLPSAPAAAALSELVAEHSPELILFGQSYDDRDTAGRLAARIDRSVLSNAIDVSLDGSLSVSHEIFGGTEIATATLTGDTPYLVVVRPKSFPAEPAGDATPEVREVPLPDEGRSGATIRERHVEERPGPKLEEAAVIVSGGRGIGSAEGYELIESVARPLGAATGATRAIVDAGWVPYAKQIGQTGKTVKPDVYIAAGISGAMQHLVGMKDAKTIIAVNKDPDAPIFSIADLGIVGDVHQVLPKLAEELDRRT